MEQKYAIIVAGGSGKRMGAEIPKQFIELAGKPILMHTLEAFYKYDYKISLVLVLPKSQHKYWNQLIQKHSFTIKHTVVRGGVERFYSVKNGLDAILNNGWVAVHDGVRPLVSQDTISRCFDEAINGKNVIPVMALNESIRKIKNGESKAVNRNNYFLVQTPQVFSVDTLKKAYKQDYACAFTDDASVVENMGYKITTVDGNPENIKITRPMDLKIAEVLLK
ncbi:MAG: 2-C-methyl-D-erythritol 4-phosphate cytidylyltransferase [Salinivirgaceae bacterium]|nr:2-C-methyl-D-erythritol 4-phosphate cytidylyltransferase [Salinivirgaceae bacterium]